MRRIFLFLLPLLIVVGCSPMFGNSGKKMFLDGKIVVDDEEYNLERGYYSYKDDEVELNRLDPFTPIDAAEQFDTLTVEMNSEIEFVLDEKTTIVTVKQWDEDGEITEVPIDDNSLTVPAEAGYYLYEVIAEWRKGQTTFVFDIDVH
ncbi:hypothetical protein [Sporosarcina sp. NPDC096371]|uniref:hypothetical protein n=1 Tax=Sporosarcina sp. NPDC096371 TaxID=3364530 RepID=UPI00382D40E9